MNVDEIPRQFAVAEVNPEIPLAYGPCPVCASMGAGQPPHGWEQPCPIVVARENAYIEKLEAERAYYERAAFTAVDSGGAMQAIAKGFGRIAGTDQDEDES